MLYLLVAGVLYLPLASHAQCRLGSTAAEIVAEFWQENFTTGQITTPWYQEDGSVVRNYITFKNEDITCAYYLDQDNICKACMVIPQTQGMLNSMVERYNKQYVIISDEEWKAYSQNGYFQIQLKFGDNQAFFIIH